MVSCNTLWIDPRGYHPSAPCTRHRELSFRQGQPVDWQVHWQEGLPWQERVPALQLPELALVRLPELQVQVPGWQGSVLWREP